MIIGLICTAIFFFVVYMVLLYLFYSASLMLWFTISTIFCVLIFFLAKYFVPPSYNKMYMKALPAAIRKDEEEAKAKYEVAKKRIDGEISKNNDILSETRKKLRSVNERVDACQVIPSYYKNPAMIRVIEAYIRTERADSVKQAINLYEKEKLTAKVIDAEARAAQATPEEEMRREAFKHAAGKIHEDEYAHEEKMHDIEKRRSKLQFENDLLSDELERGRKINKY